MTNATAIDTRDTYRAPRQHGAAALASLRALAVRTLGAPARALAIATLDAPAPVAEAAHETIEPAPVRLLLDGRATMIAGVRYQAIALIELAEGRASLETHGGFRVPLEPWQAAMLRARVA